MAYATRTEVSVERSRIQIERMVGQVEGVDRFLYSTDNKQAVIMFRYCERVIKWTVELPDRNGRDILYRDDGRERSVVLQEKLWKQRCRSIWRSLYLIIKAKLEAIESGIVNFEDEFLPYTALPDGSTVGKWAKEKIDKALGAGKMPQLQLTCGAVKVEN